MPSLETLRARSLELFETLRDPRAPFSDRENAFEKTLSLTGGFWQGPCPKRHETLRGFLTRVTTRAVRILESKGVRRGSIDPDDLAQEVLLIFFERAHTIVTPNGKWFVTVAARTAMRLRRDELLYLNARDGLCLDSTAGATAGEEPDCEDTSPSPRLEEVRRAMVTLPAGLRAVVQLQLLGHDPATVAKELGLTAATVRQRIHRVRVHLQKALA